MSEPNLLGVQWTTSNVLPVFNMLILFYILCRLYSFVYIIILFPIYPPFQWDCIVYTLLFSHLVKFQLFQRHPESSEKSLYFHIANKSRTIGFRKTIFYKS